MRFYHILKPDYMVPVSNFLNAQCMYQFTGWRFIITNLRQITPRSVLALQHKPSRSCSTPEAPTFGLTISSMQRSISEHLVLMLIGSDSHILLAESVDVGIDVGVLLPMKLAYTTTKALQSPAICNEAVVRVY